MIHELVDIPSSETAALEAIKFQVDKAFPKELTALMQSIFDFTERYNRDFNIDSTKGVKDHKEAKDKHAAIKKFIVNDITPKMRKLVLKHTGMEIKNIIADVPINNSNVGSIFCWLSNINEIEEYLLYAAEGWDVGIDISENVIKKAVDIGRSLDKETGKVIKSIKHIGVVIGLPVSMFTYSDYLPSKMHKLQLTAEELAAVMLHEIGHAITFIEAMAKLTFSHRMGNNILDSIDTAVKNDPKKTLSTMKKLLKNSDAKLKVGKIPYKKVLDYLSEAEEQGYNDSFFFPILVKLITAAIFVATMFHVTIALPITIAIIDILSNTDAQTPTDQTRRSIGKSHTLYERAADEYVSRYFMSVHLNKGLLKIYDLFAYFNAIGEMPSRFSQVDRNSLMTRLVLRTLNGPSFILTTIVGFAVEDKMSSYEVDDVRLARNIANLRDSLNQPGIPSELKLQVLKDIDIMEKQYQQYKSSVSIRLKGVAKFLAMFIPKMISSSIDTVFMSGDINRTYGKFLTGVDDLLSNKGAETAARIRAILQGRL